MFALCVCLALFEWMFALCHGFSGVLLHRMLAVCIPFRCSSSWIWTSWSPHAVIFVNFIQSLCCGLQMIQVCVCSQRKVGCHLVADPFVSNRADRYHAYRCTWTFPDMSFYHNTYPWNPVVYVYISYGIDKTCTSTVAQIFWKRFCCCPTRIQCATN